MSIEARAFGASFAFHGGVLLAVLALGGPAVRAPATPRVIDLRLLDSQAAAAATTVAATPRPRQERAPEPAAARPVPPPEQRAVRPVPEPPPPPEPTPTPEVARAPELPPTPAPVPDPDAAPRAPTSEDADAAPAAVARSEAATRAEAGVRGVDVGAPPVGPTASAPATGAGTLSGDGARADAAPTGQASAATPEGIPGGVAGGVPRDLAALREIVQRGLAYPGLARRMGWEGRVTLSFLVCRDGRAREVAVVESSGRELLDQCAVDSVKRLTGLPASTAEAKVIVPLVYRLH